MRVLIHEQEYQGHHYLYLGAILPALAELVDEVVVVTTERGLRSVEFEKFLAPVADRVDFRGVLPPHDPLLTIPGRFRRFHDLRRVVRQVRPDYLLVPSGDGLAMAMGMSRPAGRGGLPGDIPAEVGIHYGCGLPDIGAARRLKDRLLLEAHRISPWAKIHYVSLTNYELARSLGPSLARRASLLPHPVPASPRHEKGESRRRLGLPEDGRYIGLAALLDWRKAIIELLAAFRRAATAEDRLLLVGRLSPYFARLIASEYADLVRDGRLIVRDGFYDQETLDLTLGALDVVCTPYPGFGQLSAAMMEGIAAGRPVLVNHYGWMKAMVQRFGLGVACDVRDVDAFAAAIRASLDRAGDYRETEATRRLLEFHQPSNFTAHWLAGIRQTLGLPAQPTITWSRVQAALDQREGPSLVPA